MSARMIAVAVLSLAAGTTAAAELDRMFFTPEQRAILDKSRKQNGRTETSDEFKPPAPPVPHNVSVTGLIRRSDGKYTIWLNNHAVNEHQMGAVNAGVGRRDNNVRLKAPDGKRTVDVKVGQTLDVVSGTVEENYMRRGAAKSAPGVAAGNENSAPDVPNVMSPESREPVKSETLARRRPARDADGDGADDFRPNRRMELK